MMINPTNQWSAPPFHEHVMEAITEDAQTLGEKFDKSLDDLRGAYLKVWLAFVTPAGNA